MASKTGFLIPLQERIPLLANDLQKIVWRSTQENLRYDVLSLDVAKATFEVYKKRCAEVDEQDQQPLIKHLDKLDKKIKFSEKLIEYLVDPNSIEVDPRVNKVLSKLDNKGTDIPFEKLRIYSIHLTTLGKFSPNQNTQKYLTFVQGSLQQAQSIKLDAEPDIQKHEVRDNDLIEQHYPKMVSLNTGRQLISVWYLEDMLEEDAKDPFSLTFPRDWLALLIEDGHCHASVNLLNGAECFNLENIIDPPHECLFCLDTKSSIAPEQTIDQLTFLQQRLVTAKMEKLGAWIRIGKRHYTMIVYSSGKACLLNQYGDRRRGHYPYHVLFSNLSQAGKFLQQLFGDVAQSMKLKICSSAWTSFSNAKTWKGNVTES